MDFSGRFDGHRAGDFGNLPVHVRVGFTRSSETSQANLGHAAGAKSFAKVLLKYCQSTAQRRLDDGMEHCRSSQFRWAHMWTTLDARWRWHRFPGGATELTLFLRALWHAFVSFAATPLRVSPSSSVLHETIGSNLRCHPRQCSFQSLPIRSSYFAGKLEKLHHLAVI